MSLLVGVLFCLGIIVQKGSWSQSNLRQSPKPNVPNNNYSAKTLANAIKADLQDALTNKSRQKKYFPDYQVFDDGDITIRTRENKKLCEELQENFNRNYTQRREKGEEDARKHIKKHGSLPSDYWESWESFKKEEIWKSDLELNDHQEIVDLIRRITKLTTEKADRKVKERIEKLNNNNKLFESQFEIKTCPWKNGLYVPFHGKEKGEWYTLYIQQNHSALFFLLTHRDKKAGFYLIEGAENIPFEKIPSEYQRNNHNELYKMASLSDKIIIAMTDF